MTSAIDASRLPPITPPKSARVALGQLNTLVDPYDPVDVNWQRWLPGSATSNGNEVVAYIDGAKAFADITAAIRRTAGPGDFIYLLGWNLDDFPLRPGDPSSSVSSLLVAASARGVAIRAMLYRHNPLLQSRDNTSMVHFINSLPTGAAIHDDRVLEIQDPWLHGIAAQLQATKVGAHHQKVLLVRTAVGLVAFQGGMDIDADRLHLGGGPGLHDVHTRIMGPAAHWLYRIFVERWTDHPASQSLAPIVAHLPVPGHRPSADLFVHVARTYGNGSSHPGISPSGYAFAPTGEQGVKRLIMRAIGAAQRFIYLEDQYLVDPSLSDALRQALPGLKKLIILVCNEDGVRGELHQPGRRRKEFLAPLLAAAPDRVHVCYQARRYMHAKTWIFDDRFAIIGSANVNRRGMTHDSEQAVGVFDVNKRKRWFFAHELRMHLWARHLNVDPFDTLDPIASSVHWSKGHTRGEIAPYTPDPSRDTHVQVGYCPFCYTLHDDNAWNNLIDPDGS